VWFCILILKLFGLPPSSFVTRLNDVICFAIALNDALKEEIQHLKVLTGQVPNYASFGGGQQLYPNNQAMHTFLAAQQFQQLQIHSQKQQQQQQQQFQLHQLQQQQLQQQQEQQQQQQGGDLKMRGSLTSSSQKDNGSEANSSSSKD
jgi:hypothetical protein